jgi:hypothetical protein
VFDCSCIVPIVPIWRCAVAECPLLLLDLKASSSHLPVRVLNVVCAAVLPTPLFRVLLCVLFLFGWRSGSWYQFNDTTIEPFDTEKVRTDCVALRVLASARLPCTLR